MARYALVIGISKYDKFTHLPKAATDAEAIAQLLEQHRYTVIRLPRKLVSENQWAIDPDKKLTAAELSTELKTFLRERATRQEVVIYFAGHGFCVTDALTDEEVGYLATSDSTKDGQNAVRVDALNTLLSKSDLGSLVMLLDCCYAGTLIEQRSLLQPTQGIISQKQNYCLIAACRDFERAREGEQHGIFTAAVLRGLSPENAANGDITSTDLLGFISRVLQPSGQEVIHAGMGQSIPLVAYQPTQAVGASEQRERSHPTTERSPAEQCQAYALAQKLRAWFETLGYRFERHEVWAEDSFEWIINIPVRRNRYDRVLVRGINGELGLRDIATLRQSVTQQRTDEGWLVTTRRISRAAREAVEQAENELLGCYTLDELLDQDADFSGYLTWLESEIQQREIESRYVPLACTKEEFDPETKQRMGVSRYDERDGWIDGYIDLWLDDPAKEHLSVLGEFGTGKTWFAFHYAWKALQRYKDAQRRGVERPRLPLVIPLRDYAKAVSVESLFSEFFFRKHEIPIPGYTAFEQLNRMGKLLLIFDGFDEMAARVDRQQMINNFWELAKVVVPGAKVILTCRTEHFPEAKEGRALLNAELQASTKGLTGETPQFEVLELEKLNDTQIRQVLALQTQPATVEQVMNNAQLLDLARRPVMTELILEALPEIEAGKPVDMARVYLYAVRRKMERDIKAERTFTSLADKLYFLCELSWEMLSTDQMSLNYRQFPDRIRRLFGNVVQEEKDLDHWHYDMMSQTMLIRNADGDYMPAHRSLLEFFVAYKFAAELGALAPDFLELAQTRVDVDVSLEAEEYTWFEYFEQRRERVAPLKEFVSVGLERLRSGFGKEVLAKALVELLVSMLKPSLPDKKHPLLNGIELTRKKSYAEAQNTGGNAATLLVKLNQFALSGKNLNSTILRDADFTEANLRQSDFSHSDLSGATFSKAFGSVWSVALSSDTTQLITGDSTGRIHIWETHTGRGIAVFKGHLSAIRALVFVPDTNFLISASADNLVKLWDIKSKKCLKVFEGHTNVVISIALAQDGKTLVSGSGDKTVKLWDLESGQCLTTFRGHTDWIRSVSYNSEKKIIASGGRDRILRLWDCISGECQMMFEDHDNAIMSVSLDTSRNLLASGCRDGNLRIWNIENGKCFQILKGHFGSIHKVLFDGAGNLISSSADRTIKFWDISNGECIKTLEGHNSHWIHSVILNYSTDLMVSATPQEAKVWNLAKGTILKNFNFSQGDIDSIAYHPSGNMIASSSPDKTIKLWDIKSGKCLTVFNEHTGWVTSVAFEKSGELLVSGSHDGTVRVWSVTSNKCIQCLTGHTDSISSITFGGHSEILISGSNDRTVKIWNVRTGRILISIQDTSSINSVAFNSVKNWIATGNSDGLVKIWNAQTGSNVAIFQGHLDWVRSIAFSPSGNFLATASSDCTTRIWDLHKEKCIYILKGHNDRVNSVAFGTCNNLITTSGFDCKIRLWDISTGECLRIFSGHSTPVLSVAFSPDAKTIISSSISGTIRAWDIETGHCASTIFDRPYSDMKITGVRGLTEAEKVTLKALGAVED